MSSIKTTTYIVCMDTTIDNVTYFKVGKTNNLEKRLRIYQLHNPAITDILYIDDDIEEDILFDYRWERMTNESGRLNEWIQINYENIIDELIEKYDFKIRNRTIKPLKLLNEDISING